MPAVAAAKYFPRTPPLRVGMSYSGLSSSTTLVLGLFVGMGFGSGCRAAADESNLIRATVGVSKEEDTLLVDRPMVMKRLSSSEWSGSGRVSARGSVKTVRAS